jgi:putative ABC transport system permease protein
MNPFRAIWSRFRSLGRNRVLKEEIDEELRFHLDQRTAENIAGGMSPEEAAREARKRFGNFQSVREDCHQMRGANFGESFLQDVRFGLRILRKNPGFTAVAVLTLALGIGINTAMFSMLNHFLFYPLPYSQPNALVAVSGIYDQTAADYLDEREQKTSFAHLAAFQDWLSGGNLSSSSGPAEGVNVLWTSGNIFDTLEVPPILGRALTDENNQPGHDQVVVLSHHLWMSRFNGDTNIIGRTVRLDGNTLTILGVMPANFECPPLFGGRVDLVRPLAMTPQWRQNRWNTSFRIIGRLKPGATINQARTEMRTIGQRLTKEYPQAHPGGDDFRLQTQMLGQSLLDPGGREIFWLLFGLTGLVLLIACANLANLQLARMAGRSCELGIRVALGAGRARMVRQLLTENLVVSLLGGALGLILAFACDRLLSHQIGLGNLGAFHDIPVNRVVIGFTVLVSILTTILVGTTPAWLMARADANPALKENARGFFGGRARHRLQNAFVIVQIALALSLLAATGQVAVALIQQVVRDPGWHPDGAFTARINLAGPAYDSTQKRKNFFRQLDERVAALPGVECFTWCSVLPFQNDYGSPVKVEEQPNLIPEKGPMVYWHFVGPDYFKTLGMSLRQGRDFTSAEIENDSPVVIINQALANKLWPGKNPVGQHTGFAAGQMRWLTIIGVVNDVVGANADECYAYVPPGWFECRFLVFRSPSPLKTTAPALRRIVAGIDPDLPVLQLESASQLFASADQADMRLIEGLIIAFGILGLFLAVVGVYGVTAYSISQRTGEFGIRMALGAQRGDILWLILRRGLLLSLSGAVLGIAGAIGILRVLAALIPNESPTGPPAAIFAGISESGWLIIIGVSAVLIAVGMLACWLPARRATRTDPMTALRCE